MFCGNSYNDILAYFVSLGSENAGGTRIAITPAKCTPHFASANAVAAMPPPRRNGHCFRGLCNELNSLTDVVFVEMFMLVLFSNQLETGEKPL